MLRIVVHRFQVAPHYWVAIVEDDADKTVRMLAGFAPTIKCDLGEDLRRGDVLQSHVARDSYVRSIVAHGEFLVVKIGSASKARTRQPRSFYASPTAEWFPGDVDDARRHAAECNMRRAFSETTTKITPLTDESGNVLFDCMRAMRVDSLDVVQAFCA